MKHYLQNRLAAVITLFCFLLALPAAVWSQEAYVVVNGEVLTFYYDTARSTRTGTVYGIDQKRDQYSNYMAWIVSASTIKNVTFDSSFKNYRPTTTAYWFSNLTQLNTITGINNLITSEVENMHCMFNNCSSLSTINLSAFDTSKVTDMYGMFSNCENLTSLTLWSSSTSNVTNMGNMFYYCLGLTTLDLSKFDTSKVTDMSSMFAYCRGLTSLNISNFKTANVNTMRNMFLACDKLTTLDLSGFNTSNVTDMYGMFYQCSELTALNLSNFDTSNVTNMTYMFYNCTELTTLNLSNFDTPSLTQASAMFRSCSKLKELFLTNFTFNQPNDGNTSEMFQLCSALIIIYCNSTWASRSSDNMFYGCTNLVGSVPFDESKLGIEMANPDTGYFTRKSQVDAYAVEEGDVLTFYYDTNMASRTGTVYEIKPMYDPANPIPAWAGTNDQVNDRITKVVFDSSFANYQPSRLDSWFKNCTTLSTIEGMEYLNTENVTVMNNLFDGCQSLNTIDLSHFDTSNVTDMSYLFHGCSSLNNIDLSTFDTSNVDNMKSMFQGCSSLTVLDVSKFDVSKVTIMINMLRDCTNLRTIFCDNTWSADYSYDMFTGCTSLVGVVSFSENRTGIEMANPDWGYFTALSENPEGREPYVLEENGTITFFYDKLRNERTGTTHTIILNASDLRAYPTWSGTPLTTKETITKAVFDESFKNYKPRYTSFWFCGLSKLDIIDGIEYLNTSKVYDMAFMFSGCESLEEIDLSHFDTHNASSMRYLFRGCTGLTSLDLSSFDTSNAIDLGYMFNNCSSLTSLDLTGLNTSNVTDMSGMFSGCSQLQSLNLSSFDTSNVTNMSGLFNGCSSLSNIDLSSFDTSNVTNMISLFSECSSLSNIDLSNFDTKEVTTMWGMFYYCSSLTELDLTGFKTDKVTDMSYMFSNCSNLTTIYCYDTWTCEKSESMFYECNALQGAVGYDSNKTDVRMANPDKGYFTGLFVAYAQVYNKVVTFYYDSKRMTRKGTLYMVQDDGLEAQWTDATKAVFDESFKNVQLTNLSNFFYGCNKLETIEGLDNLNTDNVTDMRNMFASCEVLTSLDLSSFNTEKVNNMSYMFFNCKLLASLDITGFNTDNVTDMSCMFSYCQSLSSLDVSNFNTGNVTNMEWMFEWCNGLTSLDVSGFNTEKVTNMSRMFRYCVKLESLDVTGFNTQNVTDMRNMFDDCVALTSLNLSGFNTEKVTNMSGMFCYCGALTTIYCNDTWTCDTSYDMFTGCTSLVGAVAYNRNATDVLMANPETGYFTKYSASSVSQINADADALVEVFNLNGVKIADSIDGLDAGIYIVHQGEIVKKVAIK